MDSLTHGCLGIMVGLLAAGPGRRRAGALAGFVGGELPDLDVLMRSATDPLFTLEYHRHFTHSLAFSPVIMLLAAATAWGAFRLFKKETAFTALLLPALLAVWSHIFCDCWTSYGTRVWWPFSMQRVSLDWISLIDPILTIPLAVCAVLGWVRGSGQWAARGLGWAAIYLTLCIIQQHRAAGMLREEIAKRGHVAERVTVKPAFANILVWRGLYAENGRFHALALRPGLGCGPLIWPGSSAPAATEALQTAKANPTLKWHQDVLRFDHFSDGWLVVHPHHPQALGDCRYAQVPDQISPLWGIVPAPEGLEHHAQTQTWRRMDQETWRRLWHMVIGRVPTP